MYKMYEKRLTVQKTCTLWCIDRLKTNDKQRPRKPNAPGFPSTQIQVRPVFGLLSHFSCNAMSCVRYRCAKHQSAMLYQGQRSLVFKLDLGRSLLLETGDGSSNGWGRCWRRSDRQSGSWSSWPDAQLLREPSGLRSSCCRVESVC